MREAAGRLSADLIEGGQTLKLLYKSYQRGDARLQSSKMYIGLTFFGPLARGRSEKYPFKSAR